jgi:YD repeat-containing protein
LTGLEEIASDNTKPDFWSFQYNPQNLPARLSFAQDYWGYYNGQTSNSSLLPQIFPTQALYSSFSPPIYSVGNRNPDSASMQAEMLTQITYPTGGTTTFNYQPNEYTALAEAYQTYNANGALRLDSTHLSPFVTTYTQVIRVNYPQSITMNCTGSFSPSYVADFGNGIVLGSVNIQENNPPTGHSPIGGGASFTGSGGTQNVVVTLSDTGTYTFTVTIPGASPDEFTTGADYAKCSGSFSYSDSIGMQPETILVGGTRIGSQVIYDGIDTNRNQYISYTYSNPLVIAPLDLQDNFVTTYEEQIKTQAVPCTYYASICFQNYLIRHSASQESFGAVQGGNIGYGTVQTTYGRHGENGYTISTFSGQSDENQTASASFPYPAVTVTDWRRGQLLQETDYTASGQVLRTKVENYQYVVPTYIHGFKTGIILKYNDGTAPGLNTVKYEEEDNKTEQVQRLSSTQTDYDQVNGNPLTTSTSYYYDNPNDLLPVRSITINSKADTVLQYSRTALEESAINTSIPLSSTAIAAIDTMINRNMIGIPLESERYVSGTLAYKTLTNYQVQPTGLVLPSTIMVQNAAYPIETRINFLEYDNYGNLLEQAKSSDENHNYIYDYTANYPIAEVVNGDSTSIAYTSFESNGTGGWILGTGSTDTTKGLTGSKSFVPSAAITRSGLNSSNTYVISYWTTASSSFTVAGTMSGYPIKGKSITLNGYTWTYYEYKVTGITSASVSGSSNIDELRLYPATAQMTTYTYLPLIGVTSKCDADNRVTYYEYDGLQRLKDIKDQDGNVVKTITYHYQGQ